MMSGDDNSLPGLRKAKNDGDEIKCFMNQLRQRASLGGQNKLVLPERINAIVTVS